MYLLWLYILITIIWKNYSKVLLVRLIVWYISKEKRRNTGWGYSSTVYPISFVWLGGIYKSKKHLEHKISSQGIPIHMGIFGFLFSLLDFFIIIICIEQLAKYRFCYEARFNTSNFFIIFAFWRTVWVWFLW